MISQGIGLSRLKRLALSLPVALGKSRNGLLIEKKGKCFSGCRFREPNHGDEFRILTFRIEEFVSTTESEKVRNRIVRGAGEHCQPPPESPRSNSKSPNGVAYIMLAVPKCPFTVFPCLPPMNRTEAYQKRASWKVVEDCLGFIAGTGQALFKPVFLGCVVIDAGCEGKPGTSPRKRYPSVG